MNFIFIEGQKTPILLFALIQVLLFLNIIGIWYLTLIDPYSNHGHDFIYYQRDEASGNPL